MKKGILTDSKKDKFMPKYGNNIKFETIFNKPIVVFGKNNGDALVILNALESYMNNMINKTGNWRCDLSIEDFDRIKKPFLDVYHYDFKKNKK